MSSKLKRCSLGWAMFELLMAQIGAELLDWIILLCFYLIRSSSTSRKRDEQFCTKFAVHHFSYSGLCNFLAQFGWERSHKHQHVLHYGTGWGTRCRCGFGHVDLHLRPVPHGGCHLADPLGIVETCHNAITPFRQLGLDADLRNTQVTLSEMSPPASTGTETRVGRCGFLCI